MAPREGFTFFSYARKDAEFAMRLAVDLRKSGIRVWLDQTDIRPGQTWDRAVQDALQSCSHLLIVLSPASVESENVMDEVSFALEQRKHVIPVLYLDCEIPLRLRRLQHVDLRLDYQNGLSRLTATLEPAEASPVAVAPRPSSPDAIRRPGDIAPAAPNSEDASTRTRPNRGAPRKQSRKANLGISVFDVWGHRLEGNIEILVESRTEPFRRVISNPAAYWPTHETCWGTKNARAGTCTTHSTSLERRIC
jgi:hypothetical protein